ncbi:MAG: acireductone synthase [Bradymonadaceae bacterium]
MPCHLNEYRAVILDIEGTTTPISFVYDVLFPYARTHLADFIETHWASVQEEVEGLREQVESDLRAGVEGVVPIASGEEEEVRESVIRNLRWQMDNDRKTTALKSLQGKIWRDGYESGALKGVVYDDVLVALKAWERAGRPVYIYSSGSVAAQELLFTYSTHGDLTVFIEGYFDTTTGPKKEAESYRAICEAIERRCEEVVFVTDNVDEARAAREAGVGAYLMDRPGNPALPEHDFEVLGSLEGLV